MALSETLRSLRGGGPKVADRVTCIRSQTELTGTLNANGDSVLSEGCQRGDIVNAGAGFVCEDNACLPEDDAAGGSG